MERSVRNADSESVNRNAAKLSIVNGRCQTENGAVISSSNEAVSCVDPYVLVVAPGVDEGGNILCCLGASEVFDVVDIGVTCHFYIISKFIKLRLMSNKLLRVTHHTLILNNFKFPMVEATYRAPFVG